VESTQEKLFLESLREKGFTMIELVVALAIIGFSAYAFSPAISISLDSFKLSAQIVDANRRANSFFLYMDKLIQSSDGITSANSTDITIKSSTDSYRIFVSGYPGTAPYNIMLSKNGGTNRLVAQDVALLSSPARPGLTFSYLSQNSSATTVTSDIKTIAIDLSFTLDTDLYEFSSSSRVETQDVEM
jgi:prepilin-type N-terminal cleavage/methylation domain-containing protein